MFKSKKILIIISVLLLLFLVGGIIFIIYRDGQNSGPLEDGSIVTLTSSLVETYENKIMSIESQEGEDLTSLNKAKKLYESLLDSIEKDLKSIKESNTDELSNLKERVENKISSINLKISKLSTVDDNSDKKDKTSSNKNTSSKKTNSTSSKKPTASSKPTSSKPTTSSKPIKYDDPAYGTVVTSLPEGNYSTWGWRCVTRTYEWEVDEYGCWWSSSSVTSISESDMEEFNKYASSVMSYPNRDGAYIGEKIVKTAWVWLEK